MNQSTLSRNNNIFENQISSNFIIKEKLGEGAFGKNL